ncbi:hypothetical protein Tco_1443308 [Tanacetum coccineum]
MLYVVNSVLTSGVYMVLEKDFADFALQEMEIHPLMLLIRTLSMNLQAFSPTLHNPSTDHTLVNYVETTLIMPQSILEDLNQQRMNDVHHKWDDMIESKNELLQSLGEMLRQREQEANLSTHTLEPSRHFNFIYYHDDGDDADEESTIPLNEIISQILPSIAITPVSPTLEPEDSLRMRDEHLSTIPEKESDEFIKSSVEDLVPIPSDSEDTTDNDSECDFPFCDNSVTFSNPLFDSNDDFTSSDDESLPEEDVPKENFKIYSNPLFEFDDEYISSDVNPLFNEVLEDIESKDSYVSKLDEPDLLVTPLSKLNEDECFDPGGDFVLEEIEACLKSDSIPPGIDDDDFDPEGDILLPEMLLNDDPLSPLMKEFNFEELKVIKSDVSKDFKDDYYDSEGDIIYLESLLIKDTIPNLPPGVFLDRDPRSLEDKPAKDDLKNIVKVFDLVIHEKTFSPTYVRLPFEDDHYLFFTYVIRIFLPYFIYLVDFPFLLSSGSEDTIFDPGISAFHFSSLKPVESHRSGTFMIAQIMKTLVLMVLSVLLELQSLIWESDIIDLID